VNEPTLCKNRKGWGTHSQFYGVVTMKKTNTVFIMICGLLLLGLAAASCSAQVFRFPNAGSQFPNVLNPYSSVQVPQPKLTNTPRLDTLMKDGKLMLSLSDAVALALENNLDIAIARYNLSIADTDILRAKAGAEIRGVATGLVEGTPGGGVGGFGTGAQGSGAGGTSGAGRAPSGDRRSVYHGWTGTFGRPDSSCPTCGLTRVADGECWETSRGEDRREAPACWD